jgi:hypothetical protein
MSAASYWPWWSLPLSICNLLLEAVCLYFLLRRRPRISTVSIYLAFLFVTDAAGLFIAETTAAASSIYFYEYWYAGIITNLLLCLIAVELISSLIPWRKFVLGWSIAILMLVLLTLEHELPAQLVTVFVNLTLVLDFAACMVVVPLLIVPDVKWTASKKCVVFGVIAAAFPPALSSIKWLDDAAVYANAVTIIFPLANLASVALLCAGACKGRRAALITGFRLASGLVADVRKARS